MSGTSTNRKRLLPCLLPGDQALSDQDIEEFGLQEAPDDAGPSWVEIAAARSGRPGRG